MGGLVGVFLVTLSAICFGTNPIFARLNYEAGANPTTYLLIRFLIASPVMYMIMRAWGYKIPRGLLLFELITLGAIGAATTASALFSTALGLVAFFAGLKRINTANAAIISTFEVVVTASLAIAILGESLSMQKLLGACLVMSAVVILAKTEYFTDQANITKRNFQN